MTEKISRLSAAVFIGMVFKQLIQLTAIALFSPQKIKKYATHFAELYSKLWDFSEHSISNKGFELPSAMGDTAVQKVNAILTDIYDGKFASLSFGGSSGALLTLLTAVIPKLAPDRKFVLFDENCHQSTIGGLIFGRWTAIRIPRIIHPQHQTSMPIQASQIEAILKKHGPKNFAAIVLVLPSYDGFRAQSEELKIYAYAKSHGITIIADGAWDSTCFRQVSRCNHPFSSLCDVWITSPHKRGLCPSSLGCMLTDREDITALWDAALDLGFRSSSVSFVEIMIAEHRLSQIASGDWEASFKKAEAAALQLRHQIKDISPNVYVVEPHHINAESTDPSHILINTSKVSGFDARLWAKNLSDHFALDAEKASPTTLLLLCASPINQKTVKQTISKLKEAFLMTLNQGQVV